MVYFLNLYQTMEATVAQQAGKTLPKRRPSAYELRSNYSIYGPLLTRKLSLPLNFKISIWNRDTLIEKK
jgi:hypothetical protein